MNARQWKKKHKHELTRLRKEVKDLKAAQPFVDFLSRNNHMPNGFIESFLEYGYINSVDNRSHYSHSMHEVEFDMNVGFFPSNNMSIPMEVTF